MTSFLPRKLPPAPVWSGIQNKNKKHSPRHGHVKTDYFSPVISSDSGPPPSTIPLLYKSHLNYKLEQWNLLSRSLIKMLWDHKTNTRYPLKSHLSSSFPFRMKMGVWVTDKKIKINMTLHVLPAPFFLETMCMAKKMPHTNISVSFESDKMDELHHRTPSQLKGTYFYLSEWNSCSPSVLPYLIPSRLFCVGYRRGWKASKYLQYSMYLTPPPFIHSPGASLVFSNILVFFKSREWCWQLLKSWHCWS